MTKLFDKKVLEFARKCGYSVEAITSMDERERPNYDGNGTIYTPTDDGYATFSMLVFHETCHGLFATHPGQQTTRDWGLGHHVNYVGEDKEVWCVSSKVAWEQETLAVGAMVFAPWVVGVRDWGSTRRTKDVREAWGAAREFQTDLAYGPGSSNSDWVGRSAPGNLLFRSATRVGMSDRPTVEQVRQVAEAFYKWSRT